MNISPIPAPELAGRSRRWRFFIDPYLLFIFCLFGALSCFLLYETSTQNLLFQKQISNYLIALAVFLLVSQLPSNFLRMITPYLFFLGVVLLVLVLFIGIEGKGAQRWLSFGSYSLQPSEFFKILLPMMLAWWFDFSNENGMPKSFAWMGAVIFSALIVVLVAVQPDLGSSVMLFLAAMVTVFLAGLSWKVILFFLITVGSSLPFLWLNMHAYQKQRILTFLDPYQDPLGSGYHIIQSTIAIGSGGVYGLGWLNGTQSRLNFVPEQHTDFIFTVLSEEFGLLASVLLIVLYWALMMRGLFISRRVQTNFLRYLVATLSTIIFIYVSVNIGMVLGLLPVVGLPLPLISYGGSALVTYAIIFGIFSSAYYQKL